MEEVASGGSDAVAVDIEVFQDCVSQLTPISSPTTSDTSTTSEDEKEEIVAFRREDLNPNWVSSIKVKILLEPEIIKSSSASKSCSIHRVPNWIRRQNSTAYDPKPLSKSWRKEPGIVIQRDLNEDYDAISQLAWLIQAIYYDLLLMENQIPFFVLQRLSGLIDSSDSSPPLAESALKFFLSRCSTVLGRIDGSNIQIRHLLHLLHTAYVLCPALHLEKTSSEFEASHGLHLHRICKK
ncbi:hypothetical protein AAC387_Pa11g2076 [Persea americana]